MTSGIRKNLTLLCMVLSHIEPNKEVNLDLTSFLNKPLEGKFNSKEEN